MFIFLSCVYLYVRLVLYHLTIAIEMPLLMLASRIIVHKFVQRLKRVELDQSMSTAPLEDNEAPVAMEMCDRDQVRSVNDVRITSVPDSPASSTEVKDRNQNEGEKAELKTEIQGTVEEGDKEPEPAC